MDWFTGLDTKTRTLAVLALGAVLSLGLALWAVLGQTPAGQQKLAEPVAAFPGLEDLAGSLSALTVTTAEDKVRLALRPNGQWVVESRGGYPANIQPLLSVVRGLAELRLMEPKTANPERHGLIGLADPAAGGSAIDIRLEGTGGAPLAALLVGNPQANGLDGLPRHYVRRPDEDQTWLAAGRLDIETELTAWLRQGLVEIDRERIQSVDVAAKGAPRYRLVPESEGRQRYFRPDPLPAGQRVKDRFQTNSIASIFENLRILDVRPRAEMDFAGANRVTYRTDEGLTLDLEWVTLEDKVWATLDAGADPPPGEPAPGELAETGSAPEERESEGGSGTDAGTGAGADAIFEPPLGEPASAARSAELEADAIEKMAAAWAFQIPNYRADQLAKPLADLLEPLPEPVAVPDPGPAPAGPRPGAPGASGPDIDDPESEAPDSALAPPAD